MTLSIPPTQHPIGTAIGGFLLIYLIVKKDEFLTRVA